MWRYFLGDFVKVDAFAQVGHEAQIKEFCEITARAIIGGFAKIHSRLFIGTNATIRNRAELGNSSFVAMDVNIVSDVNSRQIVEDNPACDFRSKNNDW